MAICVFVVILALSVATADINVSDYVYWKKADISAYHEYFPSRALQEESLTNAYAQLAAQDVALGLEESLRSVARYQAQELATAQLMMEGTSAQGCVEGQGMSTYIDSAIQQEISEYEDCAADVESRLSRARNNWYKIYQYYWSVYQRALAGIDTCAKTYPNNDSLSRLKSCVESWNSKYFTVANTTKKYNSLVSPSMSIFSTVAECAQTAAKNVVDKGWQFLQKLVYCSKLSENIDEQEYEEQLKTGFSRYLTRNDLTAQILQAQILNRQQVSQVEEKLLFYYDLQRKALENYVIESRGLDYYYYQVNDSISGFYNTIDQISIDYPSNIECISMAKSALSSIVTAGSEIALACDQKIVANTQYLLSTVNSQFLSGNSLLPYTGNVAILECFFKGYIFAEDTIMGCFNVTSSLFSVEYKEALDRVVKDVDTLLSYQDNFFGNSSLPCSDSVLRRVYWGAEQVLFNLGRCVYIDSGSEYPTNITATGSLTVQERRSWKKIFRNVAKNVAIGYVINSIG